MTAVQRTLLIAALTIGSGAGIYALGSTQAHGSTQSVVPVTVAATTAGGSSAGITVVGTGSATGTPDELQLSLQVSTQASSASAALDQANSSMNTVRDTLRAHGVADADMQTTGLSVQAMYDNQQAITGYQVNEGLTANLKDMAKAGATITAVSSAAGNTVRIDNVSLNLSDSGSSLMGSARAAAMNDAKARATQYATAAGRSLGPVLSISEQTAPTQLPYSNVASGAASSAAPVPISPGTQQVSVTVTVTYAFS